MAYEKTNWIDGVTPINAQRLNKIEQGIVDASKIMSQKAGGTATAITLQDVDFIDGFTISFVVRFNNNGTATTINGKPVYKPNTTTAPNFTAGKNVTVWYDSAGGCFFYKASAEGNAIAGEVLAGKIFSNDDDTGIVGTMPNRGTFNSTLTNQSQQIVIPSGFHNGSGRVTANITNLSAGNIRQGVSVGGIAGTFNNSWRYHNTWLSQSYEFRTDGQTINIDFPRGVITSVSQIKLLIFTWDMMSPYIRSGTSSYSPSGGGYDMTGFYNPAENYPFNGVSAGYSQNGGQTWLDNISIVGSYIRVTLIVRLGGNVDYIRAEDPEIRVFYQL